MNDVIFAKIWFSVYESTITVLLSVIIGGGIALLEHMWKQIPPKYFVLLMILPLFMPTALVAVGFVKVLGNAGYINTGLNLVHLPSIHLLYTPYAIILGNLFYNIPLAYLTVQTRLQQLHHYLTETAISLGASRWQAFWVTIWPRLQTTVVGISIIIFLYSFMSFSLPLILGGIRYQTLEVYIYTIITQRFDIKLAWHLAVGQWIGLTALILVGWKNYQTTSEPKLHLIETASSKKRRCLSLIRLSLIFFVLAPLLAIVFDSFSGTNGHIMQNYIALWHNHFWPAWWRTFILTLLVIGNILILSLGTTFIKQGKFANFTNLLLAVSPVTFGIFVLWLIGKSLIVLTLIYIALLLPLTSFLLVTRWQTRPIHFVTTLQTLGANYWQTLLAKLRFSATTIIRLMAFSFAFVFGDITLANLLTPYNKPLVMGFSYALTSSYRFHVASAGMSVVLYTILLGVSLIMLIGNYYEHT